MYHERFDRNNIAIRRCDTTGRYCDFDEILTDGDYNIIEPNIL